jgi:hypothetical protein
MPATRAPEPVVPNLMPRSVAESYVAASQLAAGRIESVRIEMVKGSL